MSPSSSPEQVKSNIRELEGMLNRVIAFSSLTGKPLSLDLAKETLKDILPPEHRKVLASEIVKHVARHYGLKVSEIKSRNNSKQIAFPRQVAMYLCKRLTDLSYPEIGKQFNDKHHSTVMYSVDKIEQAAHLRPDVDRTSRAWSSALQLSGSCPSLRRPAPVTRLGTTVCVRRAIQPWCTSPRDRLAT